MFAAKAHRMPSAFLVALLFAVASLAFTPSIARAQGYGSINNFDAVNDNGVPCHGFEIELDDIHTTCITYTYDWNHYGVPNISEDKSDPAHPKVFVRYEAKRNPDGSWSAYTAVPSSPISPTDGHQFTNPSINFGGEHFGVGFYCAPSNILYHWLIDDGSGNLIRGTQLAISTPVFTYFPPPDPGQPAQVQAIIVVPPPPEVHPKEFGDPVWVKETRTESHNNREVKLEDLVDDDPTSPTAISWRNGEPDEVEVEWQLMQEDFKRADGGNNAELQAAPQELPNGDEVITRRYDFYKYIGPLDDETGEAKADAVGPDGIHGVGTKTINGVEVDLSTLEVVGEFIGAQMAGFDVNDRLGQINNVQDAYVNEPYVDRSIVVGGLQPVLTTHNGDLPDGMTFNEANGVLSGVPTVTGSFTFTVTSADFGGAEVTNSYTLKVLQREAAPLTATVTTGVNNAAWGSTLGDGVYTLGQPATVEAVPNAGFGFVNWTENGIEVSPLASYTFTVDADHSFTANFTPLPQDDLWSVY